MASPSPFHPSSPCPSRAEPLYLLRSGDGPAEHLSFPEIRKRFDPRVARWVRLCGVAERDRPDVAQVAWIRIHEALPSYLPDLPIEPWLCTIARNVARNHRQRGYVQHEVLAAAAPPPLEIEPHVHRKLDAEALLERVLPTLSDDEWNAFVLADLEEMPCRAVAELLGVPEETITSRLHRARRAVAAARARMEAADRRRAGMVVPWPAFLLGWRERLSRLWAWLDGRFLAGAVTGGAIVYFFLRPPAPIAPPLAQAPADPRAPSSVPRSEPLPALPAPSVDARSREASAEIAPAVASAMPASTAPVSATPAGAAVKVAAPSARVASTAAASGSGTAPGPAAAPGSVAARSSKAGGSEARERERAERWSELAALEAALVLLDKGNCDEAQRRLAPHAARLAAGPFAPEYHALQRKARACPR